MTLEEAQAALESRFIIGPLGDRSLAPTGERYVVICSGGIKEEAERRPCICSSPEAAIRLWKDAVDEYAAGKTGVLYWRTFPEIDEDLFVCDGFADKYYSVYSRLLISDQSIVTRSV